ncbi:TPA: hypothetical protein ACOEBE_000225 [Stenotrophomonas maltophilia]
MTRADWIGVAGIVIGIPGLLVLFLGPNAVAAVLAVVLLLVIGGAVWAFRWGRSRPPFSMKKVGVHLVVHDDQGIKATLSKCYSAIPQYGHLSEMTHRNIGADGAITQIKWNGELVDQSWVQQSAGQYSVNIRFPGPLTRDREYSWTLSYDADNSFLGNQESLYYVVDFPAKEVNITVSLPNTRGAKSAHCFLVQGASKKPLADPSINSHNGTIHFTVKKPRVGSEYEIAWNW